MVGQEAVFVPGTVVLKGEWMLRGVYEIAVGQVTPPPQALAGLLGVTVEDAAMVAKAMDWAEAGLDFVDSSL